MIVYITTPCTYNGVNYPAGWSGDLPVAIAQGLISNGYATMDAYVPNRVQKPIAGNTLVIIGDSFDVRSGTTITSNYSYQNFNTGIWALRNMALKNKFVITNIDAVNGSGALNPGTGTNYQDRLANAVLPYNCRWVSVRASVNDFSNGYSLAQIIAAYSGIFDWLSSLGKKIITNTVGPIPTAQLGTAALREIRTAFNQWVSTVAPNLWDLICIDEHWQYMDPNATTGQPVGNSDVHPSMPYAWKIAKTGAARLAPHLTGLGLIDLLDSTGDYSSGYAVSVNSTNVGTTGTAPGLNITGSVADSLSMATTGNLGTVTTSKVARTDGPGYWQQCSWTPTAAGQILQLQTVANIAKPTSFAVGDWIQFLMEFEVDATSDAAALECPRVWFRQNGATEPVSGQLYEAVFGNTNSQVGFGESGFSGVAATPPIQIKTGCTSFTSHRSFVAKTTGISVVRIGRHGFVNLTKLGLK